MNKFLLFASLLLSTFAPAQAQQPGFEETFARASDRSAVLEQLIPGTPDYYYYHCLQYQHLGQLGRVPELMKIWKQRHGRTARYQEIENRQALLGFSSDPGATIKFLSRSLGLHFDYQPQVPGQTSPLPTRLDPELLTLQAWMKRALAQEGDSLGGIAGPMLESMASQRLSARQLRQLLERLQRPDVSGLAALAVRDLQSKSSRGFGSLEIHKRLLLDQLEDCLALRPQLLNERAFIAVYLTRLAPAADLHWADDAIEREAYLDRLWAFASRLPSSSNGLKSHILQHRLLHDLGQGQPSRARLLEFLRLPRRSSYVNPKHLNASGQSAIATPTDDDLTLLGPAGSDEALVRKYLEHFFLADNNWDAFSPYVLEDYLKRVFAETKILSGVGDMERWYSLIGDSSYYESLEQRVEIDFTPGERMNFGPDEAVVLELDTKNVGTLLVKVFEIDALAYARSEGHAVDASIDLDGLVPGSETTFTYEQPALRRVRRHYDFPSLAHPGVYVIDFIAGGLSSRAVIHKGQLQLRQRMGSAGHVLGVLNSAGEVQINAAVYLGGQHYPADKHGVIIVPYSTDPDWVPLILQSGALVSVELFHHESEQYSLQAGIHVEREALLAGGSAQILVRADLLVNESAADISILSEPVLTLVGTDVHGIQTSLDVRDIDLQGDREYVYTFPVPAGIVQLRAQLRGKVKNLSMGETQSLSSAWHEFQLNSIDATAGMHCPILGRDDEGYFVDVLGKNGEPLAGTVLRFELTHGGFTNSLGIQLKTDEQGRVWLGELPGVTSLQADGFPAGPGVWHLSERRRTQRRELHGAQGQVLRVPYSGHTGPLTRAEVSLIELRQGEFTRDRFEHLSRVPGFLELRGLAAGDFDLLLKESGQRVSVRVTAGEQHAAWALGRDRALELRRPALQLMSTEWNGENLELQLAHTSSSTRVHVFVTRFAPANDAFGDLHSPAARSQRVRELTHTASSYNSGREIGEEYRYILERRFAKKYPGNMLERPGLLLNPWAMLESDTGMGAGGGFGGRFGGKKNQRPGSGGAPSSRAQRPQAGNPGTVPNLDFLATGGLTLANLRPDKEGRLVIPADQLGNGAQIRVLVVDTETTIEQNVLRAGTQLSTRDRRLQGGIAPDAHFSEQRRIEFLQAGESTTIQDGVGTQAVTYDTLDDVFQLFRTLNPNSELDDFAFLTHWPSLSTQEKLASYTKYACHELHVFLYYKDRPFFESVLRPYLANKADKTFIDLWLLNRDLTGYLEPWAFEQLNVFEQILLGRRLKGTRADVSRHIQEQLDLTPPRPEEFAKLYGATLAAGGLSQDELVMLSALGYAGGGSSDGPSTPGPSRAAGRKAASAEAEEAQEPMLKDSQMDDSFGKSDADFRARVTHLFQALGPTKQYAEHNYFHQLIRNQNASLIRTNAFWADLAQANPGQAFCSTHFAQATGNVAEMVLALAMLDLPFEAAEHTTSRTDNQVTLTAGSPLILVRKELAKAQPSPGASGLLIGQQFFAMNDRYRYEGNQRHERLIDQEFIVGTSYGCRVVVTNPSPDPVQLEVLLQIPEGSIPINQGYVTHGAPVQLAAYATNQIEYGFYFPAAGQWDHFPAHATRDGSWLAGADPLAMNVVLEPTTKDTTSWEHISQQASQAELMTFLRKSNLLRLDLDRIAWRMSERADFDEIIALLRSRKHYNPLLWSYALQHRDVLALREFLGHNAELVARVGPWLASPLLDVLPVERRTYERLEFRPLVNARAHPMGGQREILNQQLAVQFGGLMNILGHKPELDDDDWLSVTYHLLLQDRIEEALASFARVRPAKLSTQIQYEYMGAYLDFFTPEHGLARSIAERYRDYPVPHWRERFVEILAQLDEAEGRAPSAGSGSDSGQSNGDLASAEPSLELDLAANYVTLRHRNLKQVELRYYIMDVEFLFSTNPFGSQDAGSVNFVKPTRTDMLKLPVGGAPLSFALPEEFRSSNVLVEARAAGLVERYAHYANTMAVQWTPNYGQLKVTSSQTGRPLARVYVKVFAKTASGVRFHKDGYTDLRGRFDYVSISGTDGQAIERFAVLVLDEQNGAVIREQEPPKQ